MGKGSVDMMDWKEAKRRCIYAATKIGKEKAKCDFGISGEPQKENLQEKVQVEYIRDLLEGYRQEPPGSPERVLVDRLLKLHKNFNVKDRHHRARHNILVLTYIIKTPMTKGEIKARLGIPKKRTFSEALYPSLKELSRLYFGCDTENV